MSRDQQAYMSGWCNGSAGYVHLWGLAGRVTGQELFTSVAEQAGWHVWEDADNYPTLCCGLAGRGYALLDLFRSTGDAEWLGRARELAGRAIRHAREVPDALRHSLYKGDLGIATLCADLDRPESARLPFFESVL
jgi:serine/threonine-protein kinase